MSTDDTPGAVATREVDLEITGMTVRDLVAGSGLVFEDRGVHRLRGLPD